MGLLVGQEGRAVAVTARSAPSGSSGLGSIVRVERTARLPGRVHGARGPVAKTYTSETPLTPGQMIAVDGAYLILQRVRHGIAFCKLTL